MKALDAEVRTVTVAIEFACGCIVQLSRGPRRHESIADTARLLGDQFDTAMECADTRLLHREGCPKFGVTVAVINGIPT